jgi:hypothetical protein
MRLRLLTALVLVFLSSVASADEDARALMREAAVEQAETTPPPGGPLTDAATKSTGDGPRGREERAVRGASLEAHRLAVSAASAAGMTARATAPPVGGASASRSASARNAAADAAQRGAAALAREHAVGRGRGQSPGGGRP